MLIKEKHITRMGVGPLCKLFGKSRQAFYDRKHYFSEKEQEEIVVLELVAQVRRELPGLGGHKLYKCIYQPLRTNQIKIGRDKLFTILRNNKLLIDRKRRNPKTTQSHHWFRRYPNLIKELAITQSEQLWVADITYICIGYDFNYLSIITDAYSKQIMGYCLHPYLSNDGCIEALKMALNNRCTSNALIHHSDRGVQYCSYDYLDILREHKIPVSMTSDGEGYENQIAERVNGILKTEFKLHQVFRSRTDALLAVKSSINAYNNLRPHMSCDFMTPVEAHITNQPLLNGGRTAGRDLHKSNNRLHSIRIKKSTNYFNKNPYFGIVIHLKTPSKNCKVKPVRHQMSAPIRMILYFLTGMEHSRNKHALVASVCEIENLTYIGPDTYSNIVCSDKIVSKNICRMAGIKYPQCKVITDPSETFTWPFLFPAVVKPVYEGSSLGITQRNIVNSDAEIMHLANELFTEFNQPIMIEEFIAGTEVNLAFVGWKDHIKAWSAGKRVHTKVPDFFENHLFAFEEKNLSDDIILEDARDLISNDLLKKFIKVFSWLDKIEYIRIDGKILGNEFYCIELTQDADLHPEGSFFTQLSYVGYDFNQALKLIVENCLERYNNLNPNQA